MSAVYDSYVALNKFKEEKIMPKLCSKEESLAYGNKLSACHRYALYLKGYRKTIEGEITASEVKASKEKYNLPDSVPDFDFGVIEGEINFAMILGTFYDHEFKCGHLPWIKEHISIYTDTIRRFVLKSAVNKPQIGMSQAYDYVGQLESEINNAAAALTSCEKEAGENFRDEVNGWYLTHYELGQLCGFVTAANWAIGEEWGFNEEDFDLPIDWKHFHSYLNKRAAKLKRRKIQEVSIVSQIMLNIRAGGGNGGEMTPMRALRCKLPSPSADYEADMPKLSSWSDW
jgi:hypothetical protein